MTYGFGLRGGPSFGFSRSRNSTMARSRTLANDGCQGCSMQKRSRSFLTDVLIRVPSCVVSFFCRMATEVTQVVSICISDFPNYNHLTTMVLHGSIIVK